MTEYRYPVHTSDPRGLEVPSLYRAIAPATLGGQFPTFAYETTSSATFARTRYTFGYLVRDVYGNTQRDSGSTKGEIVVQKISPPGSGFQGGRASGAYNAPGLRSLRVGNPTYAQNLPFVGAVTGDGEGIAEQEGLTLAIHVIDDDSYPDDLWLINGQRQESATGLVDAGVDGGLSLNVGQGTAHIVGWFFHLDAMTYEECMALQWNVLRTKDIPDTDPSGLGVVPDHIWSVKRAMEVGTNGVASWVSDGATGGEALTRIDGTLQVVEFDSQLSSAR